MKKGNVTLGRRDFAIKLGGFALISPLVLSSIVACSSDDDSGNLSEDEIEAIQFMDGQIVLNLNVLESLNSTGGWLLINQRRVLVLNTGNGEFSALTSICTHTGCDNAWSFSGAILTCGCHGSRFDTSGNVLNGPANAPLASFEVALENNILTVFR